jgi:hypothetical protein
VANSDIVASHVVSEQPGHCKQKKKKKRHREISWSAPIACLAFHLVAGISAVSGLDRSTERDEAILQASTQKRRG